MIRITLQATTSNWNYFSTGYVDKVNEQILNCHFAYLCEFR